MIEYLKNNPTIIVGMLGIVSSFFSALITFILTKRKCLSTEYAKLLIKQTKKKIEGIELIRELITNLNIYENLCITEPTENIIEEIREKSIRTPSICYSYKNLMEFTSKLNSFLKVYDVFLPNRSHLYLLYLNYFLTEYSEICLKKNITDEELRWVSVPLYPIIQKWYKKVDSTLINELNHPNYKYYKKIGICYNIKNFFFKKSFIKTDLYKFIHNSKSLFNEYLKHRGDYSNYPKAQNM